MANSVSSKIPISKNVVYDSGKDTSTGRKRAVDITGEVSVAERARLFGTQIKLSSTAKNPISQRPPVNNQPVKSNIVHQDRNYQPLKRDFDQHPKKDISFSSPPRVTNNYRPSPVQINDGPKREQPSSIDPHNYSTVTRPHNYRQHASIQQQPVSTYDAFQYNTPQKQANYTQIIPDESYTTNNDPYFDPYDGQKSSSSRNTNYFQPIQDPLEALYKNSAQGYSQQQIPATINSNINTMQSFDLGNLINRIQQDYLNNVRPYVSSVQFIENEQSLADIGFITPTTTRNSRRIDGSSYYYDIIGINDVYPRYSKPSYNNNYESMKRRKHRRRYHNQASSPIHIPELSTKIDSPESPPATPIQKPPTPVAASSSEEEEPSSESEDESTEDATINSSQPPNATTPAPIATGTPVTQPRPILPNQTPSTAVRTPAKQSETETSESGESDSDSDSESDEDDEKPKPSSATPSNNSRRVPVTPQINTRVIPQPITIDNNKNTNQPSEPSDSIHSFDVQKSKKSSAIRSKFQSITNKFRRKKS